MQQPGLQTIYGDRNVKFDEDLLFIDFDFTAAQYRMHIRTAPDAPGAALVDLSNVAAPAEGISLTYAGTDTIQNHIAADRMTEAHIPSGMALTDNLLLSIINVRINKSTMVFASIPAPENGDTVELSYDLLITPSGGVEDKYVYGPFVVRGTVTYP